MHGHGHMGYSPNFWHILSHYINRFLCGQSRVVSLRVHKVKHLCDWSHVLYLRVLFGMSTGHRIGHFILVATWLHTFGGHSSNWMKHDLSFSLHTSFTSFLWWWLWGARTEEEHQVSIPVSQRWHSQCWRKKQEDLQRMLDALDTRTAHNDEKSPASSVVRFWTVRSLRV